VSVVRSTLFVLQLAMLETEICRIFLREAGRRKFPCFSSADAFGSLFASYQSYLGFLVFSCVRFPEESALNTAHPYAGEKDADRIRALARPRIASSQWKFEIRPEPPAPTPLSNWLASEIKAQWPFAVIVAGSIVATEEPHALCLWKPCKASTRRHCLCSRLASRECFDEAAEFIMNRTANSSGGPDLPIPEPAQSRDPQSSNKLHHP